MIRLKIIIALVFLSGLILSCNSGRLSRETPINKLPHKEVINLKLKSDSIMGILVGDSTINTRLILNKNHSYYSHYNNYSSENDSIKYTPKYTPEILYNLFLQIK